MSPMEISPDVPSATLEQRAIAQRRQLHDRVTELRDQVEVTMREKLDVRRYAAEYAWPAAGVAALFSLLFGYGTSSVLKKIVS